nr:DUF1847 domain-containing protein [Desulfitobacterium hafniense]
MNCANCPHGNACYQGKSCIDQGIKQVEYSEAENLKMLSVASRLEAEHYMNITRFEEVIRFSQEMGYTRLGIAF